MELYRAKERALIAQLIIDLLKTAHAAHQRFTGKAKPYLTSDVESLLLGWAVLLGHVSGRPRNASEIARYLGVPRVTAKRKLDALEKGGIIVRRGSKYHMAHVELGGDDYVDRCMSLIKRAAQL